MLSMSLKGGNHPFWVFNSQTWKNYNEKRSGRKYSTDPVDVTKFEYTYYSVRCVHYGEARSRGKGLRPNQHHFPMGCQAKITASYDKLCTLMDLQCVLTFSSVYWEKKPYHFVLDPPWIDPAPHWNHSSRSIAPAVFLIVEMILSFVILVRNGITLLVLAYK